MTTNSSADHVYIGEAAELLDRRVGTIRKWHREGRLPEELQPQRDERDRRYWTRAQVEGLREWMIETDMRPGKGLPTNQNPDPERVKDHLRKLRRPRGSRTHPS